MSDDFRARGTLMDGCCRGAVEAVRHVAILDPAQVTLRLQGTDLRRCRRVRRHGKRALGSL